MQSFGRRPMLYCFLCMVVLPASGTACRGRNASDAYTVRDSAGIRVVNYSESDFARAPRWSLDSSPLLDLGANENDQFFQIRSVAALRNGGLFVANGASNDIRVYDSTGQRVATIGRSGSGPGEFQLLAWATPGSGDSIVTYDPQLQRLTIFAGSQVARTVSLGQLSIPFPFARLWLSDGSILVAPEAAYTPASAKGRHRDPLTFLRVSRSGREQGEFLRLPGDDQFVLPGPNGVRNAPLGFGRVVLLAAADSDVYVGGTDAYDIRAIRLAGTPRLILRAALEPGPVTPSLIAAYKRNQLARIEGEQWRSFFATVLDSMSYPATMAQFSALRVDDRRRLWVRDYPVHPDSTPLWRVFDTEGILLGSVAMPAAFDVRCIAGDRVLGVWRDSSDVEHVRVYRLHQKG